MDSRRFPHEHVATASDDVTAEQIAGLADLFPGAVIEGKVDFEALRALLGEAVETRPERYSFTWAGKREAMRLAQATSTATLVPEPEQSINWETTRNLFIEGDNLEVLKLLHRAYFGRVKMIYIDPPYNTGKDRIYLDSYAQQQSTYVEETGQADSSGNLLVSNPETGGRYHSKWLSMMYPRLSIARSFLNDDGVVFVSIDDHEIHDLRLLLNEVFGEENFIATIIWQKVYAPKNSARHFSEDHDYIVAYAKNAEIWRPSLLPRTEDANARYTNPDNDPRGPWKPSDLTARNFYSLGQYEVLGPTGKTFRPGIGRYWIVSLGAFQEMDRENRIWWGNDRSNMPAQKRFLADVKQGFVPQTLWTYDEVGHTQEAKKELIEYVQFEHNDNVLDSVKPTRLIQRMLQIATTPSASDVVLDFFAGSASTAHAVLKQNREDGGNRRIISVQVPESLPIAETDLKTIADIGKERIRRVIARMKREDAGKLDLSTRETPEDLGFRVFRYSASSVRQWRAPENAHGDAYLAQLELMVDPTERAKASARLLWEAAIREGYALTSRVEQVASVTGNTVYRVTDDDKEQSFFLCLDETVRLDALRPLRLTQSDLFICRDSAVDDSTGANLALQCRLKTL